MDLRKKDMTFKRKIRELDSFILAQAYKELSTALNLKYAAQTTRTPFEDQFVNLLKQSTKLKFYRSFWIQNFNIDVFIPAIKAEAGTTLVASLGFKGMAIEIDGEIHQQYFKLKQDQTKYAALHELLICTAAIENQDINSHTVQSFLKDLSKMKRLDHRAKSRLMRNIYLLTIIRHSRFIVEQSLSKSISVLKHIGEL